MKYSKQKRFIDHLKSEKSDELGRVEPNNNDDEVFTTTTEDQQTTKHQAAGEQLRRSVPRFRYYSFGLVFVKLTDFITLSLLIRCLTNGAPVLTSLLSAKMAKLNLKLNVNVI